MKIIEETGIKRTEDGGIFCEACGNDLSVEDSVHHFAHIDGKNFRTDRFMCTKCGATITRTCERSAEESGCGDADE